MDLSMEITNCGLIALRNICDFKNISAKTLISLASDNGTTLVAYKVPVNKIKEIELPAIFQSPNHFFYVGENEVLPEIEYTGVVLSNKDLKKISVENGELKNINGGVWVAIGIGAATAIYGAAEAKAADDRARQERRDALERQRLAEIAYKAEQAAAQARAAAAAKAEAERQSKLMGVLFGKKGGAGTQGGGGISKPLIIVGVSVLGLGVVAVILVLIFKK